MDGLSTRDAWRRPSPDVARDEEWLRGKRYALVIGIDDYDPPVPPLSNAVKDAAAIADRLRDDFGFEVMLLANRDANAGAVREVLERWEAETKPEDSVLVFFAGHGTNHPDEDRQKEGYLVPADASDDPSSWLAESEIIQHAKSMPARWLFLIFDACYTGSTFRHDIPTGARDDQVLKALVAGTEDQPVLDGGAREHSIFTRAVLDGLDGWAQTGQHPDDLISADELIAYVKSEVPWRSRLRGHEQTPLGGPLQGTRTALDFEFRPIKPRLPAPLLRNIYSSNAEDRVAAAKQLGVRAPSDTDEVLQQKADELIRLMRDDRVSDVRATAAEALGELGHPAGFEPLAAVLQSEKASSELRAAAASALGNLAERSIHRQDVIEVLTDVLHSRDAVVGEAAKLGLGRVPESGPQLVATLRDAGDPQKRQIVDALACLADQHPDDERAWPALDTMDARFLRRIYLARRRLLPQWHDIRRQSLALALSGAIGLILAYLIVVIGIKPWNPYGPALLSYNLLPGVLAGVSLASMPRLVPALTRHSGRIATVLGGILGGLFLGPALFIPNQFLDIGCHPVAYFLPGLVSGPLLGLALSSLPWKPMAPGEQAWESFASLIKRLRRHVIPIVITAVVGGLGFALVRVPDCLAWGYWDPPWAELLRWGYGGAIFAAALAIGWGISPSGTHQGVTKK